MRRFIQSAVMAVAVCACASPPASAQIQGVASVIDGDTIEIGGKAIRLSGFDSPERGKRCGTVNVYQKAALALSDFIGKRTVTCEDTGDRNNGRIIGICSVGGVDLGDHVVGQGWARDWPRFSKGKYAEKGAAARKAGRGIWALACPADLWSGRNYDPR